MYFLGCASERGYLGLSSLPQGTEWEELSTAVCGREVT